MAFRGYTKSVMGPLSLILLVVHAAFAADPPASNLSAAKTAARANFLAHQPGQPTIDSVVPAFQAADEAGAELKMMLDSAKEIELGCVQPCASQADMLVYRGKISMVAVKLGMTDAAAAIAHYIPQGKPRIRGTAGPGAGSAGDKMVEAKVMEQLLRDPQLPSNLQQSVGRKAVALAGALGTSKLVTADGDGVVTSGLGTGQRMTPEHIAALNKIPGAQADLLRSLASRTVPPPLTADQKQAAAMQECEDYIAKNPGQVRQARNYWIDESRDKNSNFLWRGYSYFNRGLLAATGLTEVEESAARTGWASAHPDVGTGRAVWEGTKLFGNSALFAANFVGLSGGGQVIARARALDNPVVVDGVRALGTQVLEKALPKATARAAEATEVVTNALGKTRDYKAATEAMTKYASEHLGGVLTVERGGKIGEANFVLLKEGVSESGQVGKIMYSPLVGESHEFTHATQMFANRSAALELIAQKAGKPIAELSKAEVGQAMDIANQVEKVYYAQHEAQALRTSGVLGLFPGSNYTAKLGANTVELTSALAGKPQWAFTGGQRFFGALSGMGESQLQIAGTLVTHANIPIVRDGYKSAVDLGQGWVTDVPQTPEGKK